MEMTAKLETGNGYITRIRMKNIRGFGNLDFDLEADGCPRMRTLIIGKNGTGKTTLLRSLVLGACRKENDAVALLAREKANYVTEGKPAGSIELKWSTGASVQTELSAVSGQGDSVKKRHSFHELEVDTTKHFGHSTKKRSRSSCEDVQQPAETDAAMCFCGYGVNRTRVGLGPSDQHGLLTRTATLFDKNAALVEPELMLRRMEDLLGKDGYDRALRRISRGLGLGPKDRMEVERGGGIVVSGPRIGKRIPLGAWADGYRMTFEWIMDFYMHATWEEALTKDGSIRGVLLVDEIEQHLHPSMQAEVLDRLGKLFPAVQIITTTHSPIVALGAKREELLVLKRHGKRVRVATVPDVAGYSAEDLLVDENVFDTSPHDPDVESKLKEYRHLVAMKRDKRTTKDQQRVQRLARELRNEGLLSLPKEDPILQALNDIRRKFDI